MRGRNGGAHPSCALYTASPSAPVLACMRCTLACCVSRMRPGCTWGDLLGLAWSGAPLSPLPTCLTPPGRRGFGPWGITSDASRWLSGLEAAYEEARELEERELEAQEGKSEGRWTGRMGCGGCVQG